MVAFAATSRPTHRAYAQTCVGSSSCARVKNPSLGVDRNGQYSITALTNASGTITERYAYSAYGQPAFFDGSGTALGSSAEGNRFCYTGREWDEDLGLYHYRARMYDAVSGRFLGRDPIGYVDGLNQYQYVNSNPLNRNDPRGLASSTSETVTIDPWELAELSNWDYLLNPLSALNLTFSRNLTPFVKTTASTNCVNEGCDPEISDVSHSLGGTLSTGINASIWRIGYSLTLTVELRNTSVDVATKTFQTEGDCCTLQCTRVTNTYTHDLWVNWDYVFLFVSNGSEDIADVQTVISKECCCCID